MSNLTLAFEALDYARKQIPPRTSDNKKFLSTVNFDDMSVPLETRLKAWEAKTEHSLKQQNLNELRTNKYNPQVGSATMERCQKYGSECIGRGIGNCLEYSCAVAKFLKNKKTPFDLVTYEGGDHVFVEIGEARPGDGKYPTSFGAWAADAAICDAWADIACLASEFPARWKARMSNWDNIHLYLAKVEGGFISPTNAYWYDAVDGGKKSFTQAG
jgi:hypothetical protein